MTLAYWQALASGNSVLEIVKGMRFEPVASGGFDEVGYSYRLE